MIVATTRKIVGDTRYFCQEWYALPAYKYDPTKLTVNQFGYSEKDIPDDFYKKHVIYYVDFEHGNKLVKAYEYEDDWENVTFIQGDIIGIAGTVTNDKFMQYLADIIDKLAARITKLEDNYATLLAELLALKEYIATHPGGTGGTETPEVSDDDSNFLKDLSEIDADYFNFLNVYRSALNGVSTVSVVDKLQFVSIYEEAWLSMPEEIFSNDTYLFVQEYENAFGGFDDIAELEILFGAGPHTFLETYMTALDTGLNNVPGFTSTLPTLADYGEIDPYSTTFKDVYDDELNGNLEGLAITEENMVNPDTNKMFDTIYNEAFGNDTSNNLPR